MTVDTRNRPLARAPGPSFDGEAEAHEDWSASRRRVYVPRHDQVADLDAFVLNTGAAPKASALLVTGESGAGKSSLIAFWCQRYRQSAPSAFVFEHYVGATPSSSDHVEIIRRIAGIIRDRYRVRDELPASRSRLEEDFPRFLAEVQTEPLLLVLDGLDQLDPRSRALTWLPEYLQPNVRMVVSTRDPAQTALLHARGCVEVTVQPLTRGDRLEIARRHIESSRSALTPEQLNSVTAAPSSANPLFLRTSLEAIRTATVDGGASERAEHFLAASGLQDLYARLLVRAEADLGSVIVGDVLSLVRASRRGISQADLHGLCVDARQVDAVLGRFEFFLVNRGGLLSLLHHELDEAVRTRYASDDRAARTVHLRLADHHMKSGVDSRAREIAWHLARAGADTELVALISRPCGFHHLFVRDAGIELMSHVVGLGDRFDAEAVVRRVYEEAMADAPHCVSTATLGLELGSFLLLGGNAAAAEEMLERVAGDANADRVELARALMALARAQRETGHLSAAEASIGSALDHVHRLADPPIEDLIHLQCARADLIYARADFEEAERVLREALDLATSRFGEDHAITTEVLVNIGAVQAAELRYDEALEHLSRAVEYTTRAFGPAHPLTANAMNNMASVLAGTGRFEEALSMIDRCVNANRVALGPLSGELAANLANRGLLKRRLGDIAGAERDYRAALDIWQRSGREYSGEAATMLFNIGWLYYRANRMDECVEYLTRCHEMRRMLYGDAHLDTLFAARCLMLAAWKLGQYQVAEAWCRKRIEILTASRGADHAALAHPHQDLRRLLAREPVPE